MTTINTIDDLIRILREQPEAKETVRREILTEELLALPQEIAAMARIVRSTAETQEEHSRTLNEHSRTLNEHSRILNEHSRILNEHSRILNEHSRILNEHSEALDELKTTVRDISETQQQHTQAIGELKGLAAFAPAERRYELIAIEMSLDPVRLLSPGDIAKMTLTEAAHEYDQSDLNSFRDCDLIIAAHSPSDGDCYITVQVSNTVAHSDISRAIKHAEMVTRFTGKPAFPAVSGVETADVTERRLSTDSVHMHRLPLRSVQPR